MTEKDSSKKSTWKKLDAAAKQDSSPSAKEEKIPSAEKEKPEQDPLTHPSYDDLEAQLRETENQLNKVKSQLTQFEEQKIYQLAEMDNILRRTERDMVNASKFALEKFIKELLSIIDCLETTLDHVNIKEPDAILSGIRLTLKQLQSLLEKNGVKSIDPAGKLFDSHFHEAMLTEENDELPPNTIIRVLQKGYLLHDRLIRPARVVVSKAKEKTS